MQMREGEYAMERLFQERLDRIAEAIKDQLERRKLWVVGGCSIVYLVSTCWLASRKLMWNDELYTFYIARLPSMSDVWSALATGAEQIPPFFYVVTRASLALFGVSPLAMRVPEVLGFWVMCLCLFLFVSKRSSALDGCIAMLFPLVTRAYYYAYEARPYGLVLGLCSLSLLCWQTATRGRPRKFWLMGLAVSAAAAVASHYYAVLLFIPLALGEAVRAHSLRRLDLPMWIAFGCALTPVLLFFSLLGQARIYSATFWAHPSWAALVEFYHSLLDPALLPLVAMLLLSALSSPSYPSNRHAGNHPSRSGPHVHEIAAAFGFIAMPAVALVLAIMLTGAFAERYALPAVIGFSMLFTFASCRLVDGRPIMGLALVAVFCGGFVLMQLSNVQYVLATAQNQASTCQLIQSKSENNLPVVAADAHVFMMLTRYTPQDLASRLVYLADPEASRQYLGHATIEQGLLDLRPWFPLKVEEYNTYIATHQRFLVYADVRYINGKISNFHWLLPKLIDSNMDVEMIAQKEHNLLFLVRHKDILENVQVDTVGRAPPIH
jgi:Dolichyl-phosphate-mannose-protein mannosyltransferase